MKYAVKYKKINQKKTNAMIVEADNEKDAKQEFFNVIKTQGKRPGEYEIIIIVKT
jgi:hypothetical protein